MEDKEKTTLRLNIIIKYFMKFIKSITAIVLFITAFIPWVIFIGGILYVVLDFFNIFHVFTFSEKKIGRAHV